MILQIYFNLDNLTSTFSQISTEILITNNQDQKHSSHGLPLLSYALRTVPSYISLESQCWQFLKLTMVKDCSWVSVWCHQSIVKHCNAVRSLDLIRRCDSLFATFKRWTKSKRGLQIKLNRSKHHLTLVRFSQTNTCKMWVFPCRV